MMVLMQFLQIGGYIYKKSKRPAVPVVPHTVPVPPEASPIPLPPEPEPVKPEPKIEPQWTNYPAQRNVTDSSLGEVLRDIESHMPAGHIYRDNDKVTWAHETTHGINSHLRNKFREGQRINGFYCLQDRGAIIVEPPTTIQTVARTVPSSLRGGVYNLYMVQQAGSWGDTPLYIFDEWMGYSNGTAAGLDLAEKNLWTGGKRSETVLYMLEFNVYSMCLAMQVAQMRDYYGGYIDIDGNYWEYSGYDDTQFKAFMMWNIERTMGYYQKSKQFSQFSDSRHDSYLSTLRTSGDAAALRSFAKSYFGDDWCQKQFGF